MLPKDIEYEIISYIWPDKPNIELYKYWDRLNRFKQPCRDIKNIIAKVLFDIARMEDEIMSITYNLRKNAEEFLNYFPKATSYYHPCVIINNNETFVIPDNYRFIFDHAERINILDIFAKTVIHRVKQDCKFSSANIGPRSIRFKPLRAKRSELDNKDIIIGCPYSWPTVPDYPTIRLNSHTFYET